MNPSTNSQWAPPAVAGHALPSFQTLAYLEKLGAVIIAACVIVYLVGRSLQRGPVGAMAEISGLRR